MAKLFGPGYTPSDDPSFQETAMQLLVPGTPVGEDTIAAATHFLGRPIWVYLPTHIRSCPEAHINATIYSRQPPITIGFHEYGHYVGLLLPSVNLI